jgi:periplasmic binding family protein
VSLDAVIDTGLCTNPGCSGPARQAPVEYYDGPGRFCPDCGEELKRSAPPPPPSVSPDALELDARLRAALVPGLPEDPARQRLLRIGAVAAGFVAAVVVVFLLWRGHAATGGVVAARICSTTITGNLAAQIVRAYGTRIGASPNSFDVRAAGSDPCDVRFRVVSNPHGSPPIGHEGIVAIVNPANPLAVLSAASLRDIYSGRVRNWSDLGGPNVPIQPLLPDGASDEARALATSLFDGVKVDAGVRRVPSSAEITRAVSSPSGRGSIGLVTFGSAVPAKVLALADAPAPNPLTIADGRYPLSLAVVVGSDMRAPSEAAAALIAFARARESQAIVAKAGLVTEQRR